MFKLPHSSVRFCLIAVALTATVVGLVATNWWHLSEGRKGMLGGNELLRLYAVDRHLSEADMLERCQEPWCYIAEALCLSASDIRFRAERDLERLLEAFEDSRQHSLLDDARHREARQGGDLLLEREVRLTLLVLKGELEGLKPGWPKIVGVSSDDFEAQQIASIYLDSKGVATASLPSLPEDSWAGRAVRFRIHGRLPPFSNDVTDRHDSAVDSLFRRFIRRSLLAISVFSSVAYLLFHRRRLAARIEGPAIWEVRHSRAFFLAFLLSQIALHGVWALQMLQPALLPEWAFGRWLPYGLSLVVAVIGVSTASFDALVEWARMFAKGPRTWTAIGVAVCLCLVVDSLVVGGTAMIVHSFLSDDSMIPLAISAPFRIDPEVPVLAFAEEALFRGLLLGSLATYVGWPRAILLAGIVFGFAHPPTVWTFFQSFAGGVVFGASACWSRTLLVPLVAHVIFNMVLVGAA